MDSDPKRSVIFSEDVSQQGIQHGGLWSRPDLAAAVYARGKFKPEWTAFLYSFEIKTHSGLSTSAVYEAFAHTRFVNFSYLCWQSPDPNDESSRKIIALCKEYGLGAVTCFDPKSLRTFEVHLKAQFQQTTTIDFDSFVDQRFGPATKGAISHWLASNGWQFPNERRGLR